MDPIQNPFAPGAGSVPPELAGREDMLQRAEYVLRRVQAGRHEKSQLLTGLRGVGKTVLLNRIHERAEALGYLTVLTEAPEGKPLANYVAPELKRVLTQLTTVERAKAMVARAFGALRGFASVFKLSIGSIVDVEMLPPTADTGDTEVDLAELLVATGEAVKAAGQCLAIFIDEVQYLGQEELRGLITALHRISQSNLPVIFFGAGLPQVTGQAGNAKSYAERLFDYPAVGALTQDAASSAIRDPIEAQGAAIDDGALAEIFKVTEGYPYFLQEWGKWAWNLAAQSPITREDVERATVKATAELDASFFRVRFDRLTPREQEYLRAMAELGPGPHRSGDIAQVLAGGSSSKVGTLRSNSISKGMIWSPSHGMTDFTVPLFGEFLKREIPDFPRRGEDSPPSQ